MVWSVVTHEPTGMLVALLTISDPGAQGNRLAISTARDPLQWTRATAIQADFFGIQLSCGKDGVYLVSFPDRSGVEITQFRHDGE